MSSIKALIALVFFFGLWVATPPAALAEPEPAASLARGQVGDGQLPPGQSEANSMESSVASSRGHDQVARRSTSTSTSRANATGFDERALIARAFDLLAEDRAAEAATVLVDSMTSFEDPHLMATAVVLLDLAEARRVRASQATPRLMRSVESEGRFSLVGWSTVGAIAGGIALGGLLELQDARSNVLIAMGVTGVGFTASILATRDAAVMPSTASLYGTGMMTGALYAWQGARIADLSPVATSGLTLGGGATGALLGYWGGQARRVPAGSAALMRSSVLWGTMSGYLLTPALKPADPRVDYALSLGGGVIGLSAGLIAASLTDMPRSRVLLMDLGALMGGLALGGLGIAILDDQPAALVPLFVPPMAVVGILAGGAVSLLLTRDIDLAQDDDGGAGPLRTAVLERRDGRWRAGLPVPSITPDSSAAGERMLNVTLAVGEF